MGDDHTPPGMIRLTTEIDRLTGDGSKTPTPSVLKPTRRRGATVSASDILTGKSDLQSIMKAVQAEQAAAENARRREAETVDRRLRGWGALRHALAAGTRRGRWWFYDFDGRTEAIPPHWWNSAAAEDAAAYGVVTLTRAIGTNVDSIKAVVVIEEEKATAKAAAPELEPAREAPSSLSSPLGPTDQIIEIFKEKGMTKFNGKPRDRIRSELKDAGIAFSKSEFDAAFTVAVERGYLDKLEGAPRRGNRMTDSVKGS